MSHPRGTAGRLAAAFLDSRLTPLLTAAAIALGAFAVLALPREEEPQIVVPMIDVLVAMPGASPAEVERRVTAPLERLLWELPGVEYIYATSSPGRSLVIVRFVVGHEEERALVLLNQKINANLDIIPPGVSTMRGGGWPWRSVMKRPFETTPPSSDRSTTWSYSRP